MKSDFIKTCGRCAYPDVSEIQHTYDESCKKKKKDMFPSLKKSPKKPYGWIQWKGTNSCADLHCKCGFMGHLDVDFMYHVKCPKCFQVYECSGYFNLIPLDFEPEGTQVISD